MRTAKYLFEFEKRFFNFIDIFMYIVSFFTISVVTQISIGTISIISIVTKILRQTFLRQSFKKSCQAGKFIFSNLVVVISKNFSSMSATIVSVLHFHFSTHSRYKYQYVQN